MRNRNEKRAIKNKLRAIEEIFVLDSVTSNVLALSERNTFPCEILSNKNKLSSKTLILKILNFDSIIVII